MGKKGGGTVQNYERELSQQELDLLQTQNEMLGAGIGIAEQQDARSAEQYDLWKKNYLPMEVAMNKPDPKANALFSKQLDNQMPMYAEDTSGVRGTPPQAAPAWTPAKLEGSGQSRAKGAR